MLLRIIFQAFPGVDPPDPGDPTVDPRVEGPPAAQSVMIANPETLFSPAQFQFLLGQVAGAIELVAAQGAAIEAQADRESKSSTPPKPRLFVPGFVKPG